MSQSGTLLTLGQLYATKAIACSLTLLLSCGNSAEPAASSNTASAMNGEVSMADGGSPGDVALDWCAASSVLKAKCQRCHQAPPQAGAPFPLLTYADTLAEDRTGTPRFERLEEAVQSGYMPPTFLALEPPVEQLTEAEKSTLLRWLSGKPPLASVTPCD